MEEKYKFINQYIAFIKDMDLEDNGFDTEVQLLLEQINKIKEIIDNCTEERWGADYFIIKDYFEDIASIINGGN